MFRPTLMLVPLAVPGLLALALALPPRLAPGQPQGGPWREEAPAAVVEGAKRTHPLSDDEVAKASATIDKLVAADLAAHGQQPNPAADDPTFLRRAFLTVVGRIPTVDEATSWFHSNERDKRDKLIAWLQQQPGRVHHEFTWWADLLRISTRLGDRYPGNAYADWIKQQLRAGTPYDAMVRGLLTAEGPALARGNGATGYYLRDAGMPLDNLANTVQVFLGTRVQCAQCHDHPFDKWTRKEFFELAAFTASVGVARDVKLGAYAKRIDEDNASQELRNALRMIGNTVILAVRGGERATINLPADYQYPDAKPNQQVAARTLFGAAAAVAKGRPAKDAYAEWLTAPDNPRFTQVIANRMWKQAFGLGLIDPVDNLTDKSVASNPPLLEFLTKLMVSVDYDLARFQRILYQTDAWQRTTSTPDSVPADGYRFPGPLLRRMTAEQLWDSLLTLAVPDLDARTGESAERLYKFYEDNKDKDAKGLYELAKDLGARRARQREIEQQLKALRDQLPGIPNKDSIEARRARAQIKELVDQRDALADQTEPGRMVVQRRGGNFDSFVRADELPSPAPAGHLLRTFGQSDREVIEAANASPATTQALTMLNGFVDRELLKDRAALYQQMLKPDDVGGKVDVLFLAIMTRPPTTAERELGKQEIAHALLGLRKSNAAGIGADVSRESAKAALHNLAWVLVNSNEFLFVQ